MLTLNSHSSAMRRSGRSPYSRKAWLLGRKFFADHAKHRLRQKGDLKASREAFLASRFNNLDYLLRTRYEWMKRWIEPNSRVAEFGAGAGFSSLYLETKSIVTDVVENDWVDVIMDATKIGFSDESLDAIIISNALHHFAVPTRFLSEATRVLKDGGLILIDDSYCSLLMRLILRMAHHEGYSYDINVFDDHAIANDPEDPWSGNNAISNLLFDAKEEFEAYFPGLKIVMDDPCECLLFLVSGGVTSKAPVPELPSYVLDAVAGLDKILVKFAPSVFALSRRTVLKKVRGRLAE
jgi:SAM-dependent methyltransferase